METQTHDSRNITAFFDERSDAERAIATLGDAGVDRSSIRMVEGRDPNQSQTDDSPKDEGFMATLKELFTGSDDSAKRHDTYAEGLRRGGYLVSVTAPTADRQRVKEILDKDGAIDMTERSDTWRAEGGPNGDGRSDETIEVVEEEMRVGTRDVSHGFVNVSARTVEEDVSKDVTLETEHVDIDRQPVDREITAADADAAFRDRSIEVEETSEEAVVDKTAHVTEEIHVGKDVERDTETVTGTVRHTKVDVNDERKGAKRAKV